NSTSKKDSVPASVVPPIVAPGVPLSRSVAVVASPDEGTAADQPAASPGQPASDATTAAATTPCHFDFRDGCYVITYRPTGSPVPFGGTLRVDRAAPDGGSHNIIVSGDLYPAPAAHDAVIPVAVQSASPADDETDAEGLAATTRGPSVAAAVSSVDMP